MAPPTSTVSTDLAAERQALAEAERHRLSGRPQRALQVLLAALERAPDHADLWVAAGLALARSRQTLEAERAFARATQCAPEQAEPWLHLGRMAATHGRRWDALRYYREAVRREPHELGPLTRLAACLIALGHLDDAHPIVQRALAVAPHAAASRAVAARLAQRRGDLEEAWRYVEGQPPDPHLVEVMASVALARRRPEDALPTLRLAISGARPGELRALFLKLSGDLHDALGDTEAAFAAWSESNLTRGLTFSPRQHRAGIRSLIERTAGPWPDQPAHPAADRPVLICGVPRSGTSLLEQALGCHPAIAPGGELPTLRQIGMKLRSAKVPDWADALPLPHALRERAAQQYLARLDAVDPSAPRVTDKMPNNLLQLGLLAHLLPGTRVIVCRRNPLDTGFSCFRQAFGPGLPWATDLNWIACWIETCQELYEAWRPILPLRFHEVRYEELVATPEPVLRETLAFLELPWDPAVLQPERLDRKVATASAFEVEEPIHTRSIGRAQAYAKHLGPLVALNDGTAAGAGRPR